MKIQDLISVLVTYFPRFVFVALEVDLHCLPVLVASFGKGNVYAQTLPAIQVTNISGLNKLLIKPRVLILSY